MNRKKDKQKAKEDEKLEKRRQKEEKLKKHAEKEREREKKKQEKIKQTKGPGAALTMSQPLIEDFAQSETNRIPLFLEKCVQFIEDEGLDSEGIYRVPGNRAHVELLFQKFEEGKYLYDFIFNIRTYLYLFIFNYYRWKCRYTFARHTCKCCCNCFKRFLFKEATTIDR